MKIFRLFILSFLVLFALLTALAGLLPSKVRISRAIDISAGAAAIQPEIAGIKNWGNWNEYAKHLPGSQVSGDSIKANQLSIRILSVNSNAVKTGWRQANGKYFYGVFNLIPHGTVTTVQWYFDFTFKWYPWEKFSSMVYDAQVGPQMQQSLENLKKKIENVP